MAKVKVLCPRCKTEMSYVTEVERSDGSKQVFRYYRCPACTLRLLDESYTITEEGERLVLKLRQGNRRPIVISVG